MTSANRVLFLFNVDYRILFNPIVNRVKPALGLVIHPDQTCVVLRKKILDTLVLFRDTIDYLQHRWMDTCQISLVLDQEKAFDKILHIYMMDVLSMISFGEGIRYWIHLFYADINCAVQIIEWKKDGFPVKLGVMLAGFLLFPCHFLCAI